MWCTYLYILFPFDNFRFIFHRENIIPRIYCNHFVPPNILHTPKSNIYIAETLATVVSEPDYTAS